MSGSEENWRKMADTHKMSSEQVKAAGVEGSKGAGGNVLHQRRSLPFSMSRMAVAGLLITGAVSYFVLYVKKKPEATAADVAKVSVGIAKPEDTHPKK
ncbi:hypothetical protein PIB30_013195 [Stylosanthes scabra]|uniref:Transmembrane protein n=1 Tax=Stylosanthes scabra TaxID=79078 RepID=A0ABU6Z4S4_9FABA|nr:hypothetical protein [Stylosanthes scabra]